MILLDTSVWISYLRNPNDPKKKQARERFILTPLQNLDIALCGVILFELVQGAKTPAHRLDVARIQEVAIFVDLTEEDYEAAGSLSRALLAKNKHLPMSDLLIAQCAIRHGFTLVSQDKDFQQVVIVQPRLRLELF